MLGDTYWVQVPLHEMLVSAIAYGKEDPNAEVIEIKMEEEDSHGYKRRLSISVCRYVSQEGKNETTTSTHVWDGSKYTEA